VKSKDIYGPAKTQDPLANGLTNGSQKPKKTRIVTHLSLCDTLEAYGSIADMTFSVAWNGVRLGDLVLFHWETYLWQDRPVPELVAATGTAPLGGFTLFQVHFMFSLLMHEVNCFL
jgi:cleavage and polyadenylation specificity factor subunit 1